MQLTREQLEDLPNKQQTWETSVIIPLTQNVIGGAAVFALTWLIAVAFDVGHGSWFWAMLSGVSVASLATIIRFFADDVGLLNAAWKLGAISRDSEIRRLQRNIQQLQNAQPTDPVAPSSSRNAMIDSMEWSKKHALIMIRVKWGGGGITRRDCEALGIGQKPWKRAQQLLIDAKLYDPESDQLLAQSLESANVQLNRYYQPHYVQARASDTYRPAWMI